MKRCLYVFRRLWLVGALALAAALGMSALFSGTVSAHASYVSSDPAAGAVLATAPTTVTVHFAENVDPNKTGANGIPPSSLKVYLKPELKNTYYSDQDATLVSTGQTQFPLSDAKVMTIAMKGAGNGIYEVYWQTLSANDGDPDSGVFFFGVGTGNVLGNGGASASQTTTPAGNTGSTASSGMPVWVTILVGIVALLLGGGIGTWLARRMSAPGATS